MEQGRPNLRDPAWRTVLQVNPNKWSLLRSKPTRYMEARGECFVNYGGTLSFHANPLRENHLRTSIHVGYLSSLRRAMQ